MWCSVINAFDLEVFHTEGAAQAPCCTKKDVILIT